jgi:hypothetical protein
VGPLAALVLAALPVGFLLAGVVPVQVHLPIPQKIDVTGMRRLLVAGFRASDHPDLDIDEEFIKYTRDMLKKRSTFDVIDVDAPPLPEQELKDIVRNTSYWRRLARRYTADLIVAGTVEFERTDKSGFVQEDIISPYTGQRLRRTRYAEREGFNLATRLYYFKGETGELLYEQRLTEEATFEGRGNDGLSALHQLTSRSSPEVLGVLMPRQKTETRYLFTE